MSESYPASYRKTSFRLSVGRCSGGDRVGRTVFHPGTDPFKVSRGEGAEREHSAHRIAAVERALRASEHVGAADVQHLHVVGVLVQHRNVVDIESQHRILHPRAEASEIDRGRHCRAVIGDMQVRDYRRQALGAVYASFVKLVEIDDRNRRCQPFQRENLLYGGLHHGAAQCVVEFLCRQQDRQQDSYEGA